MWILLCASSSSMVLNNENSRSVLAALTNRSGRRRPDSIDVDVDIDSDDENADTDADADDDDMTSSTGVMSLTSSTFSGSGGSVE